MDTATLVIAVTGLSLSVFSVAWQVVSHLLSGSRPKAKAITVKVGDRGYAHWPISGGARWAKRGGSVRETGNNMPGVLHLGVLVHNSGRIPVDVVSFNLSFELGPAYGELPAAGGPSSRVFNPPLPHTLGPGQQAIWTLDFLGDPALE